MDAPIMLYACVPSAASLVEVLESLFPDQKIAPEDPAGDWKVDVIVGTKGFIFRKPLKLAFNHDPDYYEGSGWPQQMNGMIGYFMGGNPPGEQMDKVVHLIQHIQFAISIVAEPLLDGEDERYGLLSHFARELDGFFFLPGVLLDPDFRSLIEADGTFSAEAEFPANLPECESGLAPEEGAATDGNEDEGEEEDVVPPTAERVARRMLVLMAVAARSLFEMSFRENPEAVGAHARLQEWVERLALGDECEPDEMRAIATPLGELGERQCIDGAWRTEGIAVLAWALGLHEISKYDDGTHTDAILRKLGFLNDEQAGAIVQKARLRSPNEMQKMGEQLLALHWRMRDFSLRPQPMNFRDWGETCWFGPIDMSWAEFGKDGDLSINGKSLSQAAPDDVSLASSVASERHLAINWLRGYGFCEVYSETDTST